MFEPQAYTHGDRLRRKVASDSKLSPVLDAYNSWRAASLAIQGRKKKDIESLTAALNEYKNFVEPVLDARANSAQEGLQPSILEEFFGYLFSELSQEIGVELLRRPASSFIGLIFNPKNINSLVSAPEYTVRSKDHDFVLGARLRMDISAEGASAARSERLVVPAVAIECKRYLERNMLDECAGTAERIKKSTPYCRYIVAAEFLKLDHASPELSQIDEIFVLRRQRNSERGSEATVVQPIYDDLVVAIYEDVLSHLKRVWWDPQSGLKTGRVFNFPR
jgi:hypothetical protein